MRSKSKNIFKKGFKKITGMFEKKEKIIIFNNKELCMCVGG